jgi:hypothetical protein
MPVVAVKMSVIGHNDRHLEHVCEPRVWATCVNHMCEPHVWSTGPCVNHMYESHVCDLPVRVWATCVIYRIRKYPYQYHLRSLRPINYMIGIIPLIS